MEIQGFVDHFKNKAHRSSLARVHHQIWKLFNQFFIRLDMKPRSWEDRLVLFVQYLIKTDKKSTIIRSYISAIKTTLHQDGVEINENKFLLTALIKAYKLKNNKVHIRIPIHLGLLRLLIKSMDQLCFMQLYLLSLYKALFTTANYGLFRIGELTEGDHILKAIDVHFGENKEKVMFILHSSKTHGPDSYPQIIKLNQIANCQKRLTDCLCPFTFLDEYVKLRKSSQPGEQFFVFRDRSPVQ